MIDARCVYCTSHVHDRHADHHTHHPSHARATIAALQEELDPTQYFANRTKLLGKLEAEGGNTYPHKFDAKMQVRRAETD